MTDLAALYPQWVLDAGTIRLILRQSVSALRVSLYQQAALRLRDQKPARLLCELPVVFWFSLRISFTAPE